MDRILCECLENLRGPQPSALDVLEHNANANVCAGASCYESYDAAFPMQPDVRDAFDGWSSLLLTLAYLGALTLLSGLRITAPVPAAPLVRMRGFVCALP